MQQNKGKYCINIFTFIGFLLKTIIFHICSLLFNIFKKEWLVDEKYVDIHNKYIISSVNHTYLLKVNEKNPK